MSRSLTTWKGMKTYSQDSDTPDRISVALLFRFLKFSKIFIEKIKHCQFIWTVRQNFKLHISSCCDTSHQISLSLTQVFEKEAGKK